MKHRINDIVVDIEWEQVSMEEDYGDGVTEWYMDGIDDNQNVYSAIGIYLHDELTDIVDIEKL